MNAPVAVVLAAGKSTRMKSQTPKVLHAVCGIPMIQYVLDAARGAGVERIVVVIGHKAEDVRQAIGVQGDVEFAVQSEQLGTGHAVMMCRDQLQTHAGPVLVLSGDTPLLRTASLQELLAVQTREQAACVIGTAVTEANQGLGRIVRDAQGAFERIVEEKDATDEQRAIREINTGCYAFDCQSLLAALDRLRPENRQSEYYLTDCPAIQKQQGLPVHAAAVFTITEAMGVNTRAQLADVQRVIQETHQHNLMLAGVSIVSPHQTYIEPLVEIGAETVVHPFTHIAGHVNIGNSCEIGPHACIRGPVTLADGTCVPPFSVIE